MAYIPGEDELESAGDDDRLLTSVYSDIISLEPGKTFPNIYGSTRFGSHGYVTGFTIAPDISFLEVHYHELEFKIIPEHTGSGLHDDDQFGDTTVAFRIKGSKGWHLP
jgi:hypothetical protein